MNETPKGKVIIYKIECTRWCAEYYGMNIFHSFQVCNAISTQRRISMPIELTMKRRTVSLR